MKPLLRFPASLTSLSAAVCVAVGTAHADNYTVPGVRYHYQVNDHYCASATIQMMLDCDAVRNNNAYINAFLAAVDPAGSPALIPVQPTYTGGLPNNAPQVAIYNLLHNTAAQIAFNGGTYFTPTAGPNTGIPLSYSNPYTPWPTHGSETWAIQWGLNVYDNPNFGGVGTHSYVAYNVAPTVAWGDYASRTIANAIHDFAVPAQIGIGSGAHSIAVTGYTSVGTPGQNQAYNLTGFYVNDPWFGYRQNEIRSGRPDPGRGLGAGEHTWMRYGYSLNPNAPLIFIPGAGLVHATPNGWFAAFNPAPPQAGVPGFLQSTGYKFVVEPLGPEALDDGNGGLLDSIPDLAPLLRSPLDAAGARTAAIAGLSDFAAEYGLSGGDFDSNLADLTLLDPGGNADWIVPYIRGGQVTGGVLVDSFTGEIQYATWLDANDEFTMTLDDLNTEYTNMESGAFPLDNEVPEPGTLTLLAMGSLVLVRYVRRRRK